MPALAIWTPGDPTTAAVAPLGLALAAGTSLVVDLDPAGPAAADATSLASLVADGPRRADLSPVRPGVAVLCNGGVGTEEAVEVLAGLIAGWPVVVLRLPVTPDVPDRLPLGPGVPVVPVRTLLPGLLAPPPSGSPAVYQRAGFGVPAPGPGPVLPVPRRGTIGSLLRGSRPAADRWVRAWRTVWRYPWA